MSRLTDFSKVLILAGLMICLGLPGAWAYESIEVSDGGAISGEVKFTGEIPEIKQLAIVKNEEHCSTSVPSDELLISADKGIKYVVITIEDITQGKAINTTALSELDNNNCRFVPHVQAAAVGTKIQIINSDPILHNTHSYLDGAKTLFNLALPLQGQKIKRKLKKPGIVSVKCDAGHTWMSAYIVVSENPYFAVTDESGAFAIEDIPPGTYTLKAWHETLGTQVTEVTIKPNENTPVSFNFSP